MIPPEYTITITRITGLIVLDLYSIIVFIIGLQKVPYNFDWLLRIVTYIIDWFQVN